MNLSSTSRSENQYFFFFAAAVTTIVLFGFVPLYTLRLLRHDPNLTLLVHAHGFVMAAWVALYLTQTLLITKHRVALHRKLGVFGGWVALLVLVVSTPTLINAAARKSHDVHSPRFLWMLAAFDGTALIVFAVLVGAALLLRKLPDYHKRFMLLATLGLLGPAFGRLTEYAKGFRGNSDIGVLLLCTGTVLVCASIDTVRWQRLHPAFIWGGASVIAMDLATYVARLML